ncbi:LY6E protein, partial [Thinocorus orbignyianus]|nr:LY6E protein [Thinocorus orbignyianus]
LLFLFVFYLFAVFFHPAYPFMCYVCQEEESNKNCLTISMCAEEEKYCVTTRNYVGTEPNKPEYVISKMCSSTCPARSQQQNQTYQSVYCCEKPLCNVNGVSSTHSSYGAMSLGVLTTITYFFTCGL